MTNRERPARGWNQAEIEERERIAASSFPPDSALDTDPEFDRAETLTGMGEHQTNGNGGEHRESYPEHAPPPEFGEQELHRTSRPPSSTRPASAREIEREASQESITALLFALRDERLRRLELKAEDDRYDRLSRRLDEHRTETRDDFKGLREQLIDRDAVAAGIREADREADAEARAAMMTEMRNRTPGPLGLSLIVLLLAATAAGAIVGAGALHDMAHDMRKQHQE